MASEIMLRLSSWGCSTFLSGGRINTDFIDNAAGVSTSDREVNLKILLDAAIRSGQVEAAERDKLLAGLADEVARQVLADSRAQIRAISFAESHAPDHIDRQIRSIRVLQRLGFDRGLAPSRTRASSRQDGSTAAG